MNDLTHIFSDKSSKSDSEVHAEEISSSDKYEKRSLRLKRRSGRYGKQKEKSKNGSSTPTATRREVVVDDAAFFDISDWRGVNISFHDGDKDEHSKYKGKAKLKEDKNLEMKIEKNKRISSRSEGTPLERKLSDQVDSLVERKISTLSWPSSDLVITDPASFSPIEEMRE